MTCKNIFQKAKWRQESLSYPGFYSPLHFLFGEFILGLETINCWNQHMAFQILSRENTAQFK